MEQHTGLTPEGHFAAGCERVQAGGAENLEFARASFEAARAEFRSARNNDRVADCDRQIGQVLDAQGRLERARQHFQQAIDYYRDHDRSRDRASVALSLSRIHRRLDQLGRAREFAQLAQELYVGDRLGVDECLYERALIALRSSRFAVARDLLADITAGFTSQEGAIRLGLATAASKRGLGLIAESESQLGELKELAAKAGRVDLVAEADFELGTTYAQLGDWLRAEQHFELARPGFLVSAQVEREADRLKGLANVFASCGRVDEAEKLYREARRVYQARDVVFSASECDLRLANLYLAKDRLAEAEHLYSRAQDGFRGLDAARGQADCALGMANVRRGEGQWFEAEMSYIDARRMYSDLGLQTEVARCDIDQSKMWRLQAEHWDGTPRETLLNTAATSIIPAALFADAGRYPLRSSAERRMWGENIAALSREEAFAVVAALGSARLMAELITYFRATGSYETPAHESSTPAPVVADRDGDESATAAEQEAAPAGSNGVEQLALTASAAAGRLLGIEGFRLAPPPYLRTPFGTLALVRELGRAEFEYGLDGKPAVAVTI